MGERRVSIGGERRIALVAIDPGYSDRATIIDALVRSEYAEVLLVEPPRCSVSWRQLIGRTRRHGSLGWRQRRNTIRARARARKLRRGW